MTSTHFLTSCSKPCKTVKPFAICASCFSKSFLRAHSPASNTSSCLRSMGEALLESQFNLRRNKGFEPKPNQNIPHNVVVDLASLSKIGPRGYNQGANRPRSLQMGNLSSHSKHQASEPATPSHTLTQDATRQIHIAAPLYSLMLPVATFRTSNLVKSQPQQSRRELTKSAQTSAT